MTLQPGTEKTGLIPVLETMLQVKTKILNHTPFYPHFTLVSASICPRFTLIFSLIQKKKNVLCHSQWVKMHSKLPKRVDGEIISHDGAAYES